MSPRPQSFEEAKQSHRPLKSSQMARRSNLLRRTRKAKPAPKKREKRPTDGQLKKRVWKEFSIFVRTRGANELGFNLCFTCPARLHWKELQAGHFIRGRLNANLFDERGCHPQCHRCNIHFQGNVVIYYKMMLLKYGQEVIDELLLQNSLTKKWYAGELQGLLDHYKNLNAQNPLLKKESSHVDPLY